MVEGLSRRIHCLGAAGAGMLPLSLYLKARGHDVSAQDDAMPATAGELFAEAEVTMAEPEVAGPLTLVYSSAISKTHPIRCRAEQCGWTLLSRGECLAAIAREKKLVAICGSHGKSTTCGMLLDVVEAMGVELDYMLGARFRGKAPAASVGSEWLVAEIDESDGTIEQFAPEIAVILNLDHDHHSLYPERSSYCGAFSRLASRTQKWVILDTATREQLTGLDEDKLIELGEGGDFRWSPSSEASSSTRLELEGADARWELAFDRVGRMNALDASFALLAVHAMGLDARALRSIAFTPIERRQSCYYNGADIQVYEDYAHHPVEIQAVLESFAQPGQWRTVLVFQPHRYSRTRELKLAFARALRGGDELVLLDVYPAGEQPVEGGSGEDLLRACRSERTSVSYFPETGAALEHLESLAAAREGSLRFLFLGAGVGDRLAAELAERLALRDARWGSLGLALGRVSRLETRLRAGEELASKTTLKVGGPAERYFEPENLEQLIAAWRSCKEAGLPLRPLGRGSNLLVDGRGVSGLVLRLSQPCWSRFELLAGGRVRVGAGMRIKALCGKAARAGLAGFEFLEGIPGSLGGVLRMNAGAMGAWVFDVVESVRYLDGSGNLCEKRQEEMSVGYRFCEELEEAIAIDAVLVSGSASAAPQRIRAAIDAYAFKRRESQPREPSAGCVFRNPEGGAAGRIIEELGLKGAAVGGAEVSPVHGNFIVNRGGASFDDVLELIRFVRKVAEQRRGVELMPEVQLLGRSWEEAL